jgi:ribosomal protein S18 acetylase RimI-like enzyme
VVKPADPENLDDVVRLIAEFRDWWGKEEPSEEVIRENESALRFYESLGFTTQPKPPGRTLFISRRL